MFPIRQFSDMVAITFPLVLAALGGAVSVQTLARRVPVNLTERVVRPLGGFAIVPEKYCPNDLTNCNNGEFCCPTSLTCVGSYTDSSDGLCCSGTEQCSDTYEATPYCADDTWTIWDRSQGGIAPGGYFCCDTGLVGLLGGTCVDPSTVLSPTLEALQIAPGGGVLSTSAVATSTAVSVTGTTIATTVTMTSTSASTATTSVVVGASGNSSVSTSPTTKPVSTLSSMTSAGVSTALTTSSSSASPSATKSSDGSRYKTDGLGFVWLIQAGLALLVGAAL